MSLLEYIFYIITFIWQEYKASFSTVLYKYPINKIIGYLYSRCNFNFTKKYTI